MVILNLIVYSTLHIMLSIHCCNGCQGVVGKKHLKCVFVLLNGILTLFNFLVLMLKGVESPEHCQNQNLPGFNAKRGNPGEERAIGGVYLSR